MTLVGNVFARRFRQEGADRFQRHSRFVRKVADGDFRERVLHGARLRETRARE